MKQFILVFVIISFSVLFAQNKDTTENHAPVFVKEIPDTTVSAGNAIQFSYKAIDSDGDSVKYFAESLVPTNSFFNSADGKLIWRPSLLQLGKNYIQILSTDGKDTVLSRIAVITVLDAMTSDGGFRLYVDTKPPDGGLVLRSFTSTSATLTASANKDYRFINWSNENSVLSSDSIYTLPIKNGLFENDRANIFANFRVNHAPVFVKEMPDTAIMATTKYLFKYEAVDPDGDSLKFYPSTPLPKQSVLLENGLFGWVPSNNDFIFANKSEVIVYVTDGNLKTFSRKTTLRIREVSSIGENSEIPKQFSLSQNYPNPFNPETTMEFTIPVVDANFASTTNHVTLKVYDVLGREVATLVDEYKQPGNYKVTFNARHLSTPLEMTSGVYFYQLRAGSFVKTKKLVLMK